MAEEKVFLHLSDIHLFQDGQADRVDLDRDLRRELERSAEDYVEDLGTIIRAGWRVAGSLQTAMRPVWITDWIRGSIRSYSALRPSLQKRRPIKSRL